MPYLVVALSGGLLTLMAMKGCEKIIEVGFNVPKQETPIEKIENGKMIKNVIIFSLGALSSLSAIYIAKKIIERR